MPGFQRAIHANRLINLARRDYGAAVKPLGKKCVPGGTRTHNLLIRSQMLYPIELQTQSHCRFSILGKQRSTILRWRRASGIFTKSAIQNPKSKIKMGGRRDSNPQQPEPQSGALPLSYDHHVTANSRF